MLLTLNACQQKTATDGKTLTIGVSPGPYSGLFLEGVKPILAAQGYRFKVINFSALLESDVALAEGTIDFNVDQHSAYMQVFNQQRGTKLANLVHIPSVPAAIFSNHHQSLKAITKGAKIAIPQDPSNAARAYRLLEKANWLELKPTSNPVLLSKNDILANPYELDIAEVDSSNIPRMLADVDYAVIPGSIVYAAQIDARKAMLQEDIIADLEISVVVREDDLTKPWAQDLKQAYKSTEFLNFLTNHNADNYWVLPHN